MCGASQMILAPDGSIQDLDSTSCADWPLQLKDFAATLLNLADTVRGAVEHDWDLPGCKDLRDDLVKVSLFGTQKQLATCPIHVVRGLLWQPTLASK